MKKTDTIAFYKEAFLAGKPEEVRTRFEEKDVEKQYSSIIAWRRRQRKAESKNEEPTPEDTLTPASIIDSLKQIKDAVPQLESIAQHEREQILGLLGDITSDIHNFDRIKKSQLLSRLESEQQEIDRQRNSLQERINNLRQELSW